jgi:RNA polymerase sigma factor (sigma-70 family)
VLRFSPPADGLWVAPGQSLAWTRHEDPRETVAVAVQPQALELMRDGTEHSRLPMMAKMREALASDELAAAPKEICVRTEHGGASDGHGKQNLFEFDRVFSPKSTQEDVFEPVAPLVQSVLDGFNVCIFAYGQTGSGKSEEDWYAVLEALQEGDSLALAKLTRLVNSFLARWNAYDFRSDWDDLLQEVIIASAVALREGRIRDRRAVVGYLRSTARFKFVDRLRVHMRIKEDQTLPWEDVVGSDELSTASTMEPEGLSQDVRNAVERLSEKRRVAVLGVYLEGKTYNVVSEESGIPLGSLKRYLREGIAQLRQELADFIESG